MLCRLPHLLASPTLLCYKIVKKINLSLGGYGKISEAETQNKSPKNYLTHSTIICILCKDVHDHVMALKVARGGKVIGEYELKEIPWRIEQGVLMDTDYYWTAGMADWKPLTELLKKPQMNSEAASGGGFWNALTLGLFAGLFSSSSRGDDGDQGGFWSPRPGPMELEEDDEEMNERLADIAEDERELMADDDSGDGDYDGDSGDA